MSIECDREGEVMTRIRIEAPQENYYYYVLLFFFEELLFNIKSFYAKLCGIT